MATYLICTAVLALCWLLSRFADRYENKKCVYAVVVILSLFAGLRGESVGIDTSNYLTYFEHIGRGEFQYAYGLEETFKYLCYAILKIIPSTQFLLVFCAAVTNYFVLMRMWDFRKVAAFGTMASCYYMGFFFMTLNTMRQFCAIAIVFYATRYLIDHKNVKYLFFVAISALFHTSGLVGVAFLAFSFLRWKNLKRIEKIFYASAVLVSPAVVGYLMLKMLRYEGDFTMTGKGVGIMVPVKIAFFAATLLFVYVLYGRDKHFCVWNRLAGEEKEALGFVCICYGIGICLIFLSYFVPMLNRVGWYFTIFEGVYMGSLIRTKNQVHRYAFGACVMLIMGYGFVSAMTGNDQGTVPYLFFWQK